MARTAVDERPSTGLRAVVRRPETARLAALIAAFAAAGLVPWSSPRVSAALHESVMMLSEYAQHHILLCLVPAFFIAGGIMVFLNQRSVVTYLGPSAPKAVAYAVASVSGALLAVCSCTVLPLFKGIHKKGAGIGPAIAFLYSGPAINILAIALTARVLGFRLGLARAIGAIVFAVVIGLLMQLIFRRDEATRTPNEALFAAQRTPGGARRTLLSIASMVGILVFINWSTSGGSLSGWDLIYRFKYLIVGLFGLLLIYTLFRWFSRRELLDWLHATRDFALQILPLLLLGVLLAGFLLGRPGHMALIPNRWVASVVGGNSLWANLFASASGALMYFATLTEVPIVQGLVGSGMGQGPALSLLLAGPSLSLPSLLVIGGELGWKKTLTYVGLVVLLSTLVGLGYGALLA